MLRNKGEREMTEDDKAAIINGFTDLINKNIIIDYTISSTMSEIDVTGPYDVVQKYKKGVKTVEIKVVCS
jgi:hypothetical protein